MRWNLLNVLSSFHCVIAAAGIGFGLGQPALASEVTDFNDVFGVRAPAEPVLLTKMDIGEPYDSMIFHDGYLWVGQNRKEFNANYRVSIFGRDGQRIHEVSLKHTANTVRPYGQGAIIVTGTSSSPNLTAWTVIRAGAGGFTAEHHWIPAEAWSNGWLGTLDGKEFFLDVGGNSDDSDGSMDPNLPAQTIFTVNRSSAPSYLKMRLRGPVSGFKHGNQFIILRKDSIASPAGKVVIVDPASGTSRDVLDRQLDRPGEPVIMPDGERLVVAEANRGIVHFANLRTGEKVEFETGGSPKSVTVAGTCLIVGMEVEKKGMVLKAPANGPVEIVGSFDFNSFGESFRGLRRVAADVASGTIYGLSAYPCNPIVQSCPDTWNAVVANPVAGREAIIEKCSK